MELYTKRRGQWGDVALGYLHRKYHQCARAVSLVYTHTHTVHALHLAMDYVSTYTHIQSAHRAPVSRHFEQHPSRMMHAGRPVITNSGQLDGPADKYVRPYWDSRACVHGHFGPLMHFPHAYRYTCVCNCILPTYFPNGTPPPRFIDAHVHPSTHSPS